MFLQNLQKRLKQVDWITIILLLLIGLISLVMVAKTTSLEAFTGEETSFSEYWAKFNFSYIRKQALFILTGFVWIALLCAMDYRSLSHFVKVGWAFVVLLLVLVLFLGKNVNGTMRWFQIGSLQLQPSEYSKLVLIILVSKYCALSVEKNGYVKVDSDFWKMAGLVAVVIMLILAEPDNGTAIITLLICAVVIFSARLSWKAVLAIAGIGATVFLLMFFIGPRIPVPFSETITGEQEFIGMPDYARMRIVNFIGIDDNPRVIAALGIRDTALQQFDSQQLERAHESMAAGGMWGRDYFTPGSYAQLKYLAAAHTDFIFSATVETFGFVGGLVLIILYVLLLARLFILAFRARDNFGFFIIIGVIAMLFAHVFENVGMNLGIMPITGIPLPFMSYGGSSTWANMLAVGLALSVNMQRDTKRRNHAMKKQQADL